jgi:hypothetical protein
MNGVFGFSHRVIHPSFRPSFGSCSLELPGDRPLSKLVYPTSDCEDVYTLEDNCYEPVKGAVVMLAFVA